MNNKDRIDHLLEEIDEMIQMIRGHKGPISANITPEVMGKLEELEKVASSFEKISQEFTQEGEAPLNLEKLRHDTLESPSVSLHDKNQLERALSIEKDATKLQKTLTKIRDKGKVKPEKKAKPKAAKTPGTKERRKLFKPLGEDKKWIPL